MKLRTIKTAIAAAIASFSVVADDVEIISVTASRNPLPIQQASSSITIITQQQLASLGQSFLADVFRRIPGVAVSKNGGVAGLTQVRMRGSEANHVLVLVDGVEVNDLAQGGEFNFASLKATDVERIEILRGSQSALWGSGAIGGVINIITKKGGGELNASAAYEYGTLGEHYWSSQVSQQTDSVQWRLGGATTRSDGENVSFSGTEKDGFDGDYLYGSINYQASEKVTLDVHFSHQDTENHFDSTDWSTGYLADSDAYSDSKVSSGKLVFTHNLDGNPWSNRFGVKAHKTQNQQYAYTVDNGYNSGRKVSAFWQTSWSPQTDKLDSATLVLESTNEHFVQRGEATAWGDPNQDIKQDTRSVVAEVISTPTDSITASLSYRYDDNDAFLAGESYRLGLAYQLGDSTKWHVALAQAVKNPSFVERYGYFTSLSSGFVGNAELEPETSKGIELGFSHRNQSLNIALSYYDQVLNNEIDGFFFSADLGAMTAVNLSEDSRRKGFEFESQWQIFDNLSAYVSAHYGLSRQWDVTVQDYARELRRPKLSGAFGVQWQLFDGRFTVDIETLLNGEQTDKFYPPYPEAAQIVSLGGFSLTNLRTRFQASDQLKLFMRIDNFFDKQYQEVFSYRGIGRNIVFGAEYSF